MTTPEQAPLPAVGAPVERGVRPTVAEAVQRVTAAGPGNGQTRGWFALLACAEVLVEDRLRLLELLRRVADEPNIDRARALADAYLYGTRPASQVYLATSDPRSAASA